MPEVTVYSASWCGPCRRAKALLERKGVQYINIDVDEVEGARDEMVERTGRMTIPQIFIADHHVGGCDDLYALETEGGLDPLLQS